MLKSLLKKLVYALIRVSPKRRYCYFKALPSFEDTAVALYEAFPDDCFDLIIWSTYGAGDTPPFADRGKTIFVKKGTLRDFYYGVVSKFIFTTHGHFVEKIPKNQVCVNVWHGMPYKGVRRLNGQTGRIDTYLLSTSELYRDIMVSAFGMPQGRVLINGLPRNDLLHQPEPDLIWEKAGIDRSRYDKVFFWLPTFRKSVFYEIVEDGVEQGNIFNIKDFPADEFNAFLEENRCLCIVKPHPMAPRDDIESTDNLLVIDEDWLWKRGLTLYPLAGVTDFLVSDISSIMIDYMLLDRPMIVCFEDSEEYQASRDMIFDQVEDWLPSTIVRSYPALLEAIKESIAGADPSREKRIELKEKFHEHDDFGATQRLLDTLFERELKELKS